VPFKLDQVRLTALKRHPDVLHLFTFKNSGSRDVSKARAIPHGEFS
jgi:hypothetical protein